LDCKQNVEIELDYLVDECVEISYDVYNLTIAAIMTGECSVFEVNYCIKQSLIVFMFQILLTSWYASEYLSMDNF